MRGVLVSSQPSINVWAGALAVLAKLCSPDFLCQKYKPLDAHSSKADMKDKTIRDANAAYTEPLLAEPQRLIAPPHNHVYCSTHKSLSTLHY